MSSPTTSKTTSTVALTTSLFINALIEGNKWGAAGSGASLSYSFPWTSSSVATFKGYLGFSNYSELNEHLASVHYGLSASQQAATRDALKAWGNVANLTFVEVADTSTNVGDIRLAWTSASDPKGSTDGWWGWSYFPSSVSPQAGDVWISSLSTGVSNPDWSAGSVNFDGLMHELGHALGLKHPFDGTPILPGSQDSQQFTVMSYSLHPLGSFGRVIENADGTRNWNLTEVLPDTPMLYDIAAMQYLYGANLNYKTGNDVYTFDPTTPFLRTIWDAGGADTISVANFTKACVIDLQAGHFSKITIESDSPNGYLWDRPVTQPTYDGTDNLAIAFGAVIENAVGGAGNDKLIGNVSNNSLDGGEGNDTMYGGAGNDTFDWDASARGGADVFYGGAGDDTYVLNTLLDNVIEYADEGRDEVWVAQSFSLSNLANVENLGAIGSTGVTLTGNLANNYVRGSTGGDTIEGGSGNDGLVGNAGDDILNGGEGGDFAVFAGTRSQYVITRTATGYTITGPDGVDSLTDIESAKFDDQSVPLANNQPNHLPTGTVTITGSATQYQTLRAANTLADVDGLGTISYQWQATGVNIANATSSVFTLGQAEVGKAVTVVVRYTDGLGNVETVTSTSTAAVAGMGTIALTPTKSWTRLVGGTGDNEGYALTTGLDGSIFVSGFTQGSLDGQLAGGEGDAFLTKYSADGSKMWTRLLGCTSVGLAQALTTGFDGAIYVGGLTFGMADGQGYAGFGDAFLTKYSADGTKSWTRLLGTSGIDLATALTTGLDGSIFVGGNTFGALDGQHPGGDTDAFVAKYHADGTKVWTRQLGGSGTDRGADLTTGLDGAIYTVGDTVGTLDGQRNAGLRDAFLTKFAADGTKVWTRLLGTTGDDLAQAVATGLDGSIYVSGVAHGSINGQAALGGDDAFLIKYSPDGTALWTRLFGSSGRDAAQALTVGIDGSIYVSGLTEGSPDGQTSKGGSDAFLTKFSVDGTKAWTRLLSSSSDEDALALTTGLDGSIFVGGTTEGPLDGQAVLGGEDAFLAKFQVVSFPPEVGTSGANRFVSRVGTQVIDGGAGLDTVVYTSTRAEHKVAMSIIGYAVTNIASGDVDSLESVERLEFADGRIALDMFKGQSGANTALLLGAVLGHEALTNKKPLVGAVINLFDQGMTLQQLSGAAMRLPIWGLLANGGGTASNTEIASYLLKTVNGAAPDAQTLSAAVASLDTETGATQGNFLWHLAESAANQVQVSLVGLMQTGLEFAS